MKDASIEEVNQFLQLVRGFKKNNKLDFILGKKEKVTLFKLGFSLKDTYALLDLLTAANYYRGPSFDHKFPGDKEQVVWEFGIKEEPTDIYIKIKIRKLKNDLLLMSFHFAEEVIIYPYDKFEKN